MILKYWLFAIMIGVPSFLLAYFITKMMAAPYVDVKGKIPCLSFKIKKIRIHLHHWLIFFLISLLLIKYYALFTFTQFIILIGGSLGVTVHGIRNYSDWKRVIVKE